MALPLSVCFWDYDRTRPLRYGRVPIKGCAPRFTILKPEDAFARAFTKAEFDVTEISLSNQMSALAEGRAAYVLIPVFLSRAFRHGCVYVRSDRGIRGPADLAGRTIGLQEYEMTAALVVRGVLRDEYGLTPKQLRWRVGDVETPTRAEIRVPPIPGVEIEAVAAGTTLDAMLADGTLDGLIALNPPECFREGSARVARLFPDWRAAEQAYVARTGIFPIMHALGIRKKLLAENPWLTGMLYDAFLEAKRLAIAELAVLQAPKVTLPWVAAELEATREVLGPDFWPYGLALNRRTLETQIRWSHEDGLTPRRLTLTELFPGGGRE